MTSSWACAISSYKRFPLQVEDLESLDKHIHGIRDLTVTVGDLELLDKHIHGNDIIHNNWYKILWI